MVANQANLNHEYGAFIFHYTLHCAFNVLTHHRLSFTKRQPPLNWMIKFFNFCSSESG